MKKKESLWLGLAVMLFGFTDNVMADHGGTYAELWKSVEANFQKQLPESAAKLLDEIEQKAQKEKNQTQLLKSWLCHQQLFVFTVEEDPQQAFIRFLEAKTEPLDAIHEALLHEEIAHAYAEYLEYNEWTIQGNLPVNGDLTKVAMKYWDKASFETCIDRHYAAALQPVEALKNAQTADYLVLYDNLSKEIREQVKYEATLFEFLFHRMATYYQGKANADHVKGDTESWWLPASSFVRLKLERETNIVPENPLLTCLKIYQELIDYNLAHSNEEILIYNDYKRFGFVNSILQQDDRYQAAMEELKKQHGEHPLSASITSLIAKNLVNQYESHSETAAYSDNYRKAKQMCEEAMAKFPDSEGAGNCRNLVQYITDAKIHVVLNQVQSPHEAIPAVLEYRNCAHPYYRIVKVSHRELEALDKMNKENKIKALEKKNAIVEQTLTLPADSGYLPHSTLIALPALDKGVYYLTACTEKGTKNSNRTLTLCFQVSGITYISDAQNDKLTIVTLNRKTGKPVEGVTVELYRKLWDYKTKTYKFVSQVTQKSDRNGQALFDSHTIDKNSYLVNLYKGNDSLLTRNQAGMDIRSGGGSGYRIQLFTDRAIYRPGQTVQFQGIVTRYQEDEISLVNNYKTTVTFNDANWQAIGSANFTTDEYGAFSGSFVIPTDRMNGLYHLTYTNGHAPIHVEAYKRPTFEVNFEQPKNSYKLNQKVSIQGEVKAYAGFGLDDVEYSYRVVRKTSFPWRCWWWWYPVVYDEQITYGNGHTDENGRFSISFDLKPSQAIAPEKQPLFTYEIEVTASSAQGETHTGTFRIRAGYNEIAISTNLPSEVEKTTLGNYEVSVSNLSGQPVRSRLARKVYRIDNEKKINYFETFRQSWQLDRKLLSDKELDRLFPAYGFYGQPAGQQLPGKSAFANPGTLVYEDELTVDGKTGCMAIPNLSAGKYILTLSGLDDTLAQTSVTFTLFEKESKSMPVTAMCWSHPDKRTAHPGEEIKLSIGSSAKEVDIRVQLMHGNELRLERMVTVSNSVQTLSYRVTEQDRGGLTWRYALVKENAEQSGQLGVQVPYDNYQLDVKLATVRDPLRPGAGETWEVNVRDYKDQPLKAALLAGMYDASLDVFSQNHWNFSMAPHGLYSHGFGTYGSHFLSVQTIPTHLAFTGFFNFSLPSDLPFFGNAGRKFYRMNGGRLFGSRQIMLKSNSNALAIEDAETADMAASEEHMAFAAAPAQANGKDSDDDDSGPLASGTDQPIETNEPTLRENFNETAFFFPQLRTNSDGSATFSFTMPDALTRWRLMLLAYTQNRQTGSNEYTFTTSKPVMIMADMPRYMYDNDTLWFVANVINTGSEAVSPKARLEIFDAATMEPLHLIVSDETIPMEPIPPGRSQEVRWKVATRYNLELLAFRFTAYAGDFSDAEQHLLPVLSSEVFLTQTLPVTVKAETEQTFHFDAIANPESHERDYSLTLHFSTNPVWYAVQALPYLANLNTNHAENAFYVFYANTLSSYIASKTPNLLAYIRKWQIETPDALHSQLEKDQDLKAILLQETPWVMEAKSESEQRSRLAALFEINNLRGQQTRALTLIQQQQQPNGGWSWRSGMPENPYISTYILTGFGKLRQMGAWAALSENDQQLAQQICERAVRYLEQEVAENYRYMKQHSKGRDWPIGSLTLSELYALSFFEEQQADKDFSTAKKYYLGSLDKTWTSFNFNQRSKAAVLLHRTGNGETARLMIQSFRECAQKNEQIGMYWPKKYFSFESHIATHANIMAAFAEIDPRQDILDQLRIWLLTQKQTNRWDNSASTADALYALLMRGSDWFEEGTDVTLRFGDTPVSTAGGVAGTGFIQRRWNASEVTPEMRRLTVNNPTNHLVWGGLFRQYFVPIDEVKSDESGFTIQRELFVETVTDKGKTLVPVAVLPAMRFPTALNESTSNVRNNKREKRTGQKNDTGIPLKVGDKITVKITFTNQQDMSFVFIKDLRAAGFEPIEQVSRYEYNDRMCYYQSNTDTDMEFFIEQLPKGTHQLEYSLFVTKEGVLNNGYALIQCQYAPEFSAYSDGMKIKVGE